ncbi:MAG: transposase [Nitrosomonadales bacterium]|nr:transposase [Nitrosomonadales bacterium]
MLLWLVDEHVPDKNSHGKRHVAITERRTRKDWATQIKEMLDERYPDAIKVRLVMDNLNTHSIASLYEAFDPKEARGTPAYSSADIKCITLKRGCAKARSAATV